MLIVSLMPAGLLSGIARFGVDIGFSVWGGVTVSDSRQRNVIDAPAAEIWSMVRFDERAVPPLAVGRRVVGKARAGTREEVARIADLVALALELKQPVRLLERKLVVAAAGHLLVAVVAVLVDVPDRQPLVGQRRVAAGLAGGSR